MKRFSHLQKDRFIVPFLSLIFTVLVFSLGFVFGRLGFNAAWENGDFSYSFKGNLYPEEKELNFDLFWEVFGILEQQYVEKAIDEQDLYYAAIKGLVQGLDDPATLFLTPEDTQEYESSRSGTHEGIGIEIMMMDGEYVIRRVVSNSPAAHTGLIMGDIIKKVGEKDVSGESITEVAKSIRGEAGTQVDITVLRTKESKEYTFTVVRQEFTEQSIEWRMLEENIAFIRIHRFSESSLSQFTQLWDTTIADVIKNNASYVIVDLRGNGGGYLDAGTYVAEEFLKKDAVVMYVENREGIQSAKKVTREGRLQNIPVVVLVDSDTASASEIFVGALQFHGRVRVIGENTYGKGTAQDILKPEAWGGASLHITTQKWLLPSKQEINNDNPIIPDISVLLEEELFLLQEDSQLERAKEELISK